MEAQERWPSRIQRSLNNVCRSRDAEEITADSSVFGAKWRERLRDEERRFAAQRAQLDMQFGGRASQRSRIQRSLSLRVKAMVGLTTQHCTQ